MSAAPRYAIAYVYASELVSVEHEPFYGMLSMLVDSFSMIIFAIYFYYIKDMNFLLIAVFIIQTILIIIALIMIPESPKFLYEKGDIDGFYKSLQHIAKFNKQDLNLIELKNLDNSIQASSTYQTNNDQDEEITKENIEKTETKLQAGNLKQLFINKTYLFNVIALSISWGVGAYSFYFTEFYMKYAPVDNIYILSMMIGISDIISVIFFEILITYFSSKNIISISYMILATLSLSFATCIWINMQLTTTVKIIYTIFVFGIRLASGTGFMISYFANNQYFPPLLRSGVFAITNIAARLATILSPLVAEQVQNPCITIVFISLLSSYLMFLLKNPIKAVIDKSNIKQYENK